VRRFTQGFYGYAFAVMVCLAGAGLFLLVTPQSRAEHIPSVDYTIDLANARHMAPYDVWAPTVPPKWVPTSSRLVKEHGAVTWRLGFATAQRKHAMLAQSDERPGTEFANRMAGIAASQGSVQVGGVTWEKRFRPDKDQRTLIRMLPGSTVVVTGSAGWPELTALAASLHTQPASTATSSASATPPPAPAG
jgi:hypothetical protein